MERRGLSSVHLRGPTGEVFVVRCRWAWAPSRHHPACCYFSLDPSPCFLPSWRTCGVHPQALGSSPARKWLPGAGRKRTRGSERTDAPLCLRAGAGGEA